MLSTLVKQQTFSCMPIMMSFPEGTPFNLYARNPSWELCYCCGTLPSKSEVPRTLSTLLSYISLLASVSDPEVSISAFRGGLAGSILEGITEHRDRRTPEGAISKATERQLPILTSKFYGAASLPRQFLTLKREQNPRARWPS